MRVITGDEVTYNAKTGYSAGRGNVKIVDKLKQRTITGHDLTYNSNTHKELVRVTFTTLIIRVSTLSMEIIFIILIPQR